MKFNITKEQLVPLLLRVGLAIVFMYAAVSSLMHPEEWVGYLPSFIEKMSNATSILKAFAVLEILLSLWLLSGRLVRYSALLAVLLLVGIIFAQPGDLPITFRDIGLVFMGLALAMSSQS
ncbi:MAG TPA: DoxX family membrane protein [Verrucomicrobiae bacterium]|nr:DoxX family membrane protein [Verrucomicrobiae bacterium]